MKRFCLISLLLLVAPLAAWSESSEPLLERVRQVTFEGRRSGEGYFSPQGDALVFQSEREPGNPFYQIYRLDFDNGEVARVSSGAGKTTCSWLFPDGEAVLFASTHLDPRSRELQDDELQARAHGEKKRYSWDYDPQFELFRADGSGRYQRLTEALGYDAEGAVSPDGKWIIFSSNRHAYSEQLSPEDQERLKIDPAYFLELYRMPAEGGAAERLTHSPGYDGGPFFSADGARICWRRFAPDGATAEIYVADADGANPRVITRLGAMSWAPYFHPSGKYLIFATNLQGFANFELYLVDAEGGQEPIRVTNTEGFDGLPVFTPDGTGLAWTSTRTGDGKSQIFMADWDHAQAMRLLGLEATAPVARQSPKLALSTDRLKEHVTRLASEEMEGRRTGTPGERKAAEYIKAALEKLGFEPAGDQGSFFQEFDFTAGVSLGQKNRLAVSEAGRVLEVDKDWRPLAFSGAGEFEAAPVVFVGYGLVAPEQDGHEVYDSYGDLEVEGRWVLMLRYSPDDVDPGFRSHLKHYASLQRKVKEARDRGARGVIVFSGPRSGVKSELVPLTADAAMGGTSIGVVSVTDEIARAILGGQDLEKLQEALDKGEEVDVAASQAKVHADIDLVQEKKIGRNIAARLPAVGEPLEGMVVVGAHYDHLGRGEVSSSLARAEEQGQIHFGADDNASGVAGLLEIARVLSEERLEGRFQPRRDLLIVAWAGEELGSLGSSHFAGNLEEDQVAVYLNMDMIGRLEEHVVLQGVGSSKGWLGLIEQINAPLGVPVRLHSTPYLPTDATALYIKEIPVLNAFTGAHTDYHTPRDTPERLDYEGMARISELMLGLTRHLAQAEEPLDYVVVEKPAGRDTSRGGLRAYLGTIPDYAQGDAKGVRLTGVSPGGPAQDIGLQAGDVIVKLAGHKVENLYDYTFAIEDLKTGEPAEIVVERGGETLELMITPGSRE